MLVTVHLNSQREYLFTSYRSPSKMYRGFKLELVQRHVTVYQGRQALFSAHEDWDGQNGWQKCREWIDENYPKSEPNDIQNSTICQN